MGAMPCQMLSEPEEDWLGCVRVDLCEWGARSPWAGPFLPPLLIMSPLHVVGAVLSGPAANATAASLCLPAPLGHPPHCSPSLQPLPDAPSLQPDRLFFLW